MIRVLITEDSPTVALLLNKILEREPDFEIVGLARDGHDAIAMNRRLKPDLITMDIVMPGLDGIDATREIMSSQPVPIVVVSSHIADKGTKYAFRALEEGAVAVLEAPSDYGGSTFETIGRELVSTLRAMAEVKLVTRRGARARAPAPAPAPLPATTGKIYVVAIGCSTGGPMALKTVLADLSPDFSAPIVITQHISDGFIGGLVDWLGQSTAREVRIAANGEQLRPGVVYFGPDDRHLGVGGTGTRLHAVVENSDPVNGFRPSVDVLMGSVARSCGASAVGAIFTGMGSDGAHGLLQLRQAGATTFVQDEETAVIYGMPGQAVALGAADRKVPLDRIGSYLTRLVVNGQPPRN